MSRSALGDRAEVRGEEENAASNYEELLAALLSDPSLTEHLGTGLISSDYVRRENFYHYKRRILSARLGGLGTFTPSAAKTWPAQPLSGLRIR
jgi:hypothetical protein